MKKIIFVCSSGGHLLQLIRISEVLDNYEKVWITFNKPDSRYLLKDEKKYWCFHPTTRNFINLFRNTIQAFKIILKEKPNIIISSGAAVAIPYFYFALFSAIKTIYIEAFNRVDSASLTGRICYPVSDLFCVQWKQNLKNYPRAKYIGTLP